jgi:hypothetical protein
MANLESVSDLQTQIGLLETQIALALSDPTKFIESIGGSVRISIPQYVAQLREYRNELQDRLYNHPDGYHETDVEETL